MSAWSYAPVLLAEEHQEPMTAAEHANKYGHTAEFTRDVPASCTGAWKWDPSRSRYCLIGHPAEGCPWHTRAGG